jgi:delta 1-pyrroline-5-carboxylate dehydrogenase
MTTKFLLQDLDLFRQQAYIAGRWCDADNGATAEVNNPATGEILGTVPVMGRAETRRAIEAAKHAWADWRRRPRPAGPTPALESPGRARQLNNYSL